ncbi:Ribosomal protein S15 [Giardia muris]|uniref:Ribosomal protein S15 n=1 Tax=Giardia muris TaxID=5742 RepID=A0A4Z1ST90_GIAMU|nr:Ribosomal protein S15 [Giardia muris]|eukprot:TNJ29146.1 Ribosomal protein S15 [Giardia muris]
MTEAGAVRRKGLALPKFRGIEVEKLVTMKITDVLPKLSARCRRRIGKHGLSMKHLRFVNKLRLRRAVQGTGKAKVIKTHLRDMIIFPEMVGTTISVYNGRQFIPVEIKPPMVGKHLRDYALTYKIVAHGKVGIGATRSSKFVPLR